MSTDTPIRLKVPQQDLQSLSLFASNREAAKEWAKALPVANPQVVAGQLVQVLDEVNRCKLHPEQRFDILGELQGNLLIAASSLSRRFLNQPLVMPEELRRQAEMVGELYALSGTGYSTVAIETLRQRDSIRGTNPARLMCEALLRAIEYSSRRLQLSFQLHQPVDINGWLTLHQLYALAERQELADIPLPGADGANTTITQVYLIALMLGCCKPNQLRQADLAVVHEALTTWSDLLGISRGQDDAALFVVDLDRDQPPLYSALYRDGAAPQCRRVNTTALVSHMQNLLEINSGQTRTGIPLGEDSRIAPGLLSHLVDALGSMSVRNFARKPVTGPLKISFGLSAAHFHAAGNRSFTALLHGTGYIPPAPERVSTNPFMTSEKSSGQRDKWSQANPEEDFVRDSYGTEEEDQLDHQVQLDARTAHAIIEDGPELPEEREYPVYEVQMANASPGGYCLEWTEKLPADVKAGELVSVQEEADGQWVIAVIRWISQLPEARTLLGLELLSPRAKPYGALIRQKTGEESEPYRVLLLPEIPLVGQPNTLLTPRAGFYEHQKVTLITQGEKMTVQLQRQLAATGSFAQFDFRKIRLLGDVIAEDKGGPLDSSYDSMWSNI